MRTCDHCGTKLLTPSVGRHRDSWECDNCGNDVFCDYKPGDKIYSEGRKYEPINQYKLDQGDCYD